jgi:RNA polymerase sigma-70 factor (ECF subfamily)
MDRSTVEIWDEFSHKVRSFILKRVSDPQDAEDILQEVFVKIHTHLDGLQDGQYLIPWLYSIARNAVIDYYRQSRPDMELSEDLLGESEFQEQDPTAQLAEGLEAMMACLPEKYRHPLVLVELKGMKQKDVAGRLGLSLSGAKSRVQRGRILLRQALLDCCHFEFDRRGNILDYSPRPDCCQSCSQDYNGCCS